MELKNIPEIIDTRACTEIFDVNVEQAFCSDLMSDVLRLKEGNFLLISGLSNIQVVRTAIMSDISGIVLVRGKKSCPQMQELAQNNNITIFETEWSMFRVAGVLYQKGLKPVF